MTLRKEITSGRVTEVILMTGSRSPKFQGTKLSTRKRSPEQIDIMNRRATEKKLERLLNANVTDKEYILLTLEFSPQIISCKEAVQEVQRFVRRMRDRAKLDQIVLKAIYVMGFGEKEGLHVHMVLSRLPKEYLELWNAGSYHISRLYSDGVYTDLAAYMIKNAAEARAYAKLIGEKPCPYYSRTRNLCYPNVSYHIVSRQEATQEPASPDGYYLLSTSSRCSDEGYAYHAYKFSMLPSVYTHYLELTHDHRTPLVKRLLSKILETQFFVNG